MATTPVVIEDRKTVIAAAVEEATKEDAKSTPEVVVEKKEEVEEKKATPTPEVDELAEQGKLLIQGLRDPAKAPAIIDFLARQAGYKKDEVPTTKAEVKEKTNSVLDELKEGLGEEFSVIAERLAPAIEKILAKELEKSQADLRQKFQEQETEKLQVQTSTALTKLTSGFFGEGTELPPEVTKEISNFMDKHAPSADASPKEYMEDAFNYAVGKLGLVKTDTKKQARADKSRTDASGTFATARVPAEINIRQDSKPMSRQDAIRAAIEAAAKDN